MAAQTGRQHQGIRVKPYHDAAEDSARRRADHSLEHAGYSVPIAGQGLPFRLRNP